MKTDNEIIAEFMGRRYGQNADRNGYLKYDTSWDHLMSVVEKINALDLPNVEIRIERFRTTYTTQGCFLLHFYNKQCGGAIGATYKAVTSFIKWYNDSVLIEREKDKTEG